MLCELVEHYQLNYSVIPNRSTHLPNCPQVRLSIPARISTAVSREIILASTIWARKASLASLRFRLPRITVLTIDSSSLISAYRARYEQLEAVREELPVSEREAIEN